MEPQATPLPPIDPTPGAESAWSDQVLQARAAGRIDNFTWSKYESNFQRAREAHFAQATTQQQASTQTPAVARIDQLRQLRIEGKATSADMQEFERLAAQLAGETSVPSPQLTTEEKLQAEIDVQMAPAQPHEYQFPHAFNYAPTPDDLATDTAIRDAMSAAGIPKHLGGPIWSAVHRLEDKFANASPEAVKTHQVETIATLQKQWGADYSTRMGAVLDHVVKASEHNPLIGLIIDEAPHLLADVGVFQWLDTVAQHRASKGVAKR